MTSPVNDEIDFPVEQGHVMMFARAVADDNPIYFDPEYAESSEVGSMLAPPTFVQASAQFNPERWLSVHDGRPGVIPRSRADVAAPATGGGARLHGEQHYEYHRPVRVGDRLRVTTRHGDTWEKQSARSGLLRFVETITEYRDETGVMVVTARSVSVVTGGPSAEAEQS